MKIKLMGLTICRTPAFSLADKIEEKWEVLKNMISQSSPSFTEIIEHIEGNELKNLNEKTAFSAWKYFNRAKYRATPFGNFAAITTISISAHECDQPVIDHNISAKEFTDWKEKDLLTTDINWLLINSALFQTNSTLYVIGEENRYICFRNGYFEIASINTFPELSAILTFCKEKKKRQQVFDLMASEFQMREKDTLNLLVQLLELQVIITEQFPNITGQDYFERINIGTQKTGINYIIAERNLISGEFDSRKLRDIPGLIDFLSNHLSNPQNEALNHFKNAFSKKFEQRAIPLTIAMDPETGVGYADLGQSKTDQELEQFIGSAKIEEKRDLQINYSPLSYFLLKGIIKGDEIQLEEFGGPIKQSPAPLPNTFSIMLRLWNNQPVIENAGSCTANSLLGRFTLANNMIEAFGHKVVEIEEKANPTVIFFDVAYQAEKNIDNVNRRKQLYNHEIPILTWSCHPSPIHLDDLLVAVRNNEVILWSKKNNKRAIPRIPSAYNYTRSDLAAYRFLCDLQYQNLNAAFNLNIRHFFPGLVHYPRIVYKKIIVSPAMWLIPKEFLGNKHATDQRANKNEFINWLNDQEIVSLFKAGKSDQTLCFDPKSNNDIDQFLLFCRQHQEDDFYISEALIDEVNCIKDENGKSYAAEYIVSYCHSDPIYIGGQNLTFNGINDMEAPGGEWLYFEIYCHPSRSNGILLNRLAKFLKENSKKIQKWFFIRYDDPAPHLRLRLHLREANEGRPLTRKLKSILDPDCLNGLISDIQVKTYFRETERYGQQRMELVERFFSADSKYILTLLLRAKETSSLYAPTLIWMQELIAICFSNISAQVTFVQNMANNFSSEMGMGPDNFKKLNQAFQQLKQRLNNEQQNNTRPHLPRYQQKLFIQLMDKCDNEDHRYKITADLVHMHINRLFFADQRTHEAILYQHLLKILKTHRALSAAQQGSRREP